MTAKGERDVRRRQIQPAIALVALVLATGTVGYSLIEGWNLWDSLFTTIVSVTTVGSTRLDRLSHAGQIFTALLLLGGVGTAFYTFTLITAGIIEARLHPRHAERRRARMIDALTDHFIVCGAGRIGFIIADEFRRQRIPFVVIDHNPDRVQAALENGDLAINADASREDVLRRVRIDRARGLIAALGTDAENVYAILSARGIRPDLYIIARADSEDAQRKLMRAGASRVISPYLIGAARMAQTALRPAVVDFVEIATSSENLELAMEQVLIGAQSSLANRSIVEANVRQRFGVIVVGIQRDRGKMEFNPASDAVMRPGDQIVVLGQPDRLKELENAAQ